MFQKDYYYKFGEVEAQEIYDIFGMLESDMPVKELEYMFEEKEHDHNLEPLTKHGFESWVEHK